MAVAALWSHFLEPLDFLGGGLKYKIEEMIFTFNKDQPILHFVAARAVYRFRAPHGSLIVQLTYTIYTIAIYKALIR